MKDRENMVNDMAIKALTDQKTSLEQLEQTTNSNHQQEESKGPSKAQELFKQGMGKFRCDSCEESFFREKEYDRHRKTAKHKALLKRRAAEKEESVEKIRSGSPEIETSCPVCHIKIKWDEIEAHHIKEHGVHGINNLAELEHAMMKKRFMSEYDEYFDFDF